MDTKKTIIVSVLTTLATMFVVAVLMHLCSGHCGNKSSCAPAKSHCSKAKANCGSSASCADYSKCSKKKSSCSSSSSSKCEKGASCAKKASCKKGKSCSDKSKCASSSCKKGEKVFEWKSEDGDKVVKKVITVEVDEEK